MQRIEAKSIMEGDGVQVYRLFPFQHDRLPADPFVLWDDFTLEPGNGFPTHSHRGFEAITYLFSGAMNHADNLGNNSTVTTGGAQRFTAGAGISHSEMPGDEDPTTGIQLWINLPQALKKTPADYQQVNTAEIPEKIQNGVLSREIVGPDSPLSLNSNIDYLHLEIPENHDYSHQFDAEKPIVLYLQAGQANINAEPLSAKQAFLIDAGEKIEIQTQTACRIMLAAGCPYNEPVQLRGGFVD